MRTLPNRIIRPYQALPFFDQLGRSDQELLLRAGTDLAIPEGTVVASSRPAGAQQCVLLLTGSYVWYEPDVTGTMQPVRGLEPGDFLDESVLTWACATEDGPGAFRVEASSDARVLAFHRSEFSFVSDRAPQINMLASMRTAAHFLTWRPGGAPAHALVTDWRGGGGWEEATRYRTGVRTLMRLFSGAAPMSLAPRAHQTLRVN